MAKVPAHMTVTNFVDEEQDEVTLYDTQDLEAGMRHRARFRVCVVYLFACVSCTSLWHHGGMVMPVLCFAVAPVW